jgi:hypothetical protein
MESKLPQLFESLIWNNIIIESQYNISVPYALRLSAC